MKKIMLAGSLMGMITMGSVNAALEVYGDLEMLEGVEGHIVVSKENSVDGNPGFKYISGAAVHISVDSANPHKANVVPEEVSADTESTIRITVGGETIDHTFKVVNEAEPEQVSGKTIAQCIFYNDYRGHTGFAGTGAFSFDKRTVDTVYTGGGGGFAKRIISTTRKIEDLSFPRFSAFTNDGSVRLSPEKIKYAMGKLWYSGLGYQAGQLDSYRRGPGGYLNEGFWTTRARDFSYQGNFVSFSFNGDGDHTNDSAAHGHWSAELEYPPEAYGGGYFDCTLSDEDEINACGGSYTLLNNQWQQISLPCYSVRSKVSEVFANIPGTYGQDWVVYRYNATDNKYIKYGANTDLDQIEGYWIIQNSGNLVTLTMPQGSIPTLVTQYPSCTGDKGCFGIPLATSSSNNQWHMISFPFDSSQRLNSVRVATSLEGCNTPAGCTLDSAKNQGIVYDQLWRYVDSETGYANVTASDRLTPWFAYWSLTLPNAQATRGVNLIVPKP